MNKPKTARVHMGLRSPLLAVASLLLVWSAQAAAQQNLGDIVKEYSFDWLIGKWIATTDEGEKIQVIYKWELDKHLVTIDLKWPDYEHRGMIFYVPAADEVVQIGVDNKGGTWKGTWDAEENKGILKIENTKADGETEKMAIIYSKVDAKTMKTELYGVRATGELEAQPRDTLEYKHKAIKTEKKAVDKPRDTSKKKQRVKNKSTSVQESKEVP